MKSIALKWSLMGVLAYGIACSLAAADPARVAQVKAGTCREARVSWWGFDAADSTRFLQAALDSGVPRLIVDKMPSPWIATPLKGASNQTVVFEPGAEIRAKRGEFLGTSDALLTYNQKINVKLEGAGTLRMWHPDYRKPPYKPAEWRHTLSFLSCSNVVVTGLSFVDSGGDGIYLGARGPVRKNTDVVIRDVVCRNNHRQGISVISAENLLIENAQLLSTHGTAPQAGIDFEPNHPQEVLRNCVMRNCRMEGNMGPGYYAYVGQLTASSAPIDLRFENCVAVGNGSASGYWGSRDSEVPVQLTFVNCRFEPVKRGAPVRIHENRFSPMTVTITNSVIIQKDGTVEQMDAAWMKKYLPRSADSAVFFLSPRADPNLAVVLPAKPTRVERSAAEELAGELGKVLCSSIAIIDETQNDTRAHLYVGATQKARTVRGAKSWQTDEVFLQSVADGVVLDGEPTRAPLYAVDLYLEKFCGVRWWTSTAAHYPRLKTAPLAHIHHTFAPPFKYRETYYLDGFNPLFKVRSKGNFTSRTRYLLSPIDFIPARFGGNHTLYYFTGRHSAYHSFFEVLPPSKYFKSHPDWYSLVNGRRVAKQLCLANEEMKQEYIRETLKRLDEDPAVDFIQVSQNDGNGCCQCEKCRALMAEDGGAASGPYLRFANAVAEAVEKRHPQVRIDTFAYQFTRKAPTKTRPRHNVVVRLCDIECDFARPLADAKASRENASFVRDLAAWQQIAGGNLFVWDYLANFTSYLMPHPNLYSIAPNIRLFAGHGVVGVFEQGDALCSAGTFAPLRHYLASHLLWDPQMDENRLIDEFLMGYYGPSATPHLKQFLHLLDQGPKTKRMKVGCYHVGAPFWTAEEKLRAADLMDAAVTCAAKDGASFAQRVGRERLSTEHCLLLNYAALQRHAATTQRPWRRSATRAEAVAQWIRDVKAAGVRAVHETTSHAARDQYFKRLATQP